MNTNKLRRALALAMAMVLCLSMLPMSAFAANENYVEFTVDSLGLKSQAYTASTTTVDGVAIEWIQLGNYGSGIQMRDKDGKTSMFWNTGAMPGGITKIEFTYSSSKSTYNNNYMIVNFGNDAKGADCAMKLTTQKNVKSYTITPDAETYTFFYIEWDTNYSSYWDSIKVYYNGEATDVTFDSLTPAVSGECVPGGELTLSVDTSSLTDQSSIGAISYQYKIDDEAEWTDVPGNILTLPATGEMGKHEVTIQAIMGGVASKTKTISYVITQIVSIADARAMELNVEGITVQGTVIFIDGKNVVVQDETAGINVYCSNAATDLVVGDIIEATGKRAAYNGLEQLTNATYTKIGTASELPVKEVTLYDVVNDENNDLESTRVLIRGVVIGAANGSNTPVAIGESSINIYKMPEHTIPVGSVVDVVAVVSDFKGYQLRVASADDVSICAMDISDYRTGETFTAPEAEGFVFGGWYTDAALTTPLAKDVTTGTAYAKFVDETVLSIKWQITSGAAIDDATTNLRLMTSVDSLLYSSVGFNVNLENYNWNFTSKTVYSTILADDVPNDAATVFCASSAYFMTITIENVTNEYFGSEFTVVPTWVTLDGTTVTGVARTFTINDAFATAE